MESSSASDDDCHDHHCLLRHKEKHTQLLEKCSYEDECLSKKLCVKLCMMRIRTVYVHGSLKKLCVLLVMSQNAQECTLPISKVTSPLNTLQ